MHRPRRLAAILIAIAAIYSAHAFERSAGVDPVFRDLIRAANDSPRRIEARVTGGFAYRPVVASTDPTRAHGLPNAALLAAAAKIQQRAAANPDATAKHHLGLALLLLEDYDGAVASLESSLEQQATGAAANDLSAALLTRGLAADRAEDVVRALALADRALARDANSLEARFNRALALMHLPLRRAARAAFADYLTRDRVTAWAEAARRHIATLDTTAVPDWAAQRTRLLTTLDRGDRGEAAAVTIAFAQASRELLEDELLPAWSDTLLPAAPAPGTPVPAQSRAMLLADVLSEQTNDPFFRDSARHLQASARASQILSARGILRYRDGRALQQQERPTEAGQAFDQAARLLDQGASPFRLRAELEGAYAAQFQARHAEAKARIQAAYDAAADRGYQTILARASVTGGVVDYSNGDFGLALDRQRRALTLYERAREMEIAASIHQVIAEPLRAMGEVHEAWQNVRAGLRLVPAIREGRRRHSLLASAALGALNQALPEVAVAVLNEDLDAGARDPQPMGKMESLMNRGRAWHRLGNVARARSDLEEAERTLALITDKAVSRRAEAELRAARAELEAVAAPSTAIRLLTDSLSGYSDVGSRFRRARLLLARGRAQRRLGNMTSAREDFLAGIDTLEQQRSSILDERFRVSHFDDTWDLYGELVRLEADAGRVQEAYVAAERSRARSLSDFLGPQQAVSIPHIQEALADHEGIVVYSLLDDRLLTWIVRRTAVTFASAPLDASALRNDLRAVQSGNQADFQPAALRLHTLLIAPAEQHLAGCTTLIVVPDGMLYRVPFAALSPSPGKYLIDTRDVLVSPSAQIYTQSRPWHTTPREPRVLVVANPTVADAGLRPLLAAEHEASAIASVYKVSAVLMRDAATRPRFLHALADTDLLHFAGHSLVSEEFPWLSRLMFATGGASTKADPLFVHELQPSQIGRLQLVVLASCSTGVGAIPRGEGVLNLARPFLMGGVPFVVVSTRDIEDDLAASIFARFHQLYASRLDAVSALATAQREMRQSGDPRVNDPKVWSGYSIVAGAGAARYPRLFREKQ
jgi:CHAT domain-containing protein/tetratricopeptide (TPR) repeat protein